MCRRIDELVVVVELEKEVVGKINVLTPSRSLCASDDRFKGGCPGQKHGAFKFSKMHALSLIDCVSGQPVTN